MIPFLIMYGPAALVTIIFFTALLLPAKPHRPHFKQCMDGQPCKSRAH